MLKLFECFSGYGGASFALKKAKIPFECVGRCEIDEKVDELYNLNFPNVKNYGDISKINIDELPDFDLITGGFPCQDISICGKEDLSKGRSILIYELLNIVEKKKPKYILLENVANILSKKFTPFLNTILERLDELSYDVHYKKLNTKDFGIPQSRNRVFFVCIRKDLNQPFTFPEKEGLSIKLNEFIDFDLIDENLQLKGKWLEWTKTESFKRYCDKKLSAVNPDISICMVARQYASWKGTFVTDKTGKIRRLSPMECFMLMGFAKDEIIFGNVDEATLYKAAGNGWDINLVNKIFEKMFMS